jgi:hypothetical protein
MRKTMPLLSPCGYAGLHRPQAIARLIGTQRHLRRRPVLL